jgi:hypothetical protein
MIPMKAALCSARSLRGLVAALLVGCLTLVSGAAWAHNPVLLDEGDALPWVAPLAPDGTVSMAFYGELDRPWTFRSAQIQLHAGEQLNVELLIPDLAPENTLRRSQLPRLLLIGPEGNIRVLRPQLREPFFEEFTQQHLIYLAKYRAIAAEGTYSLVVTGPSAARFVAVSGDREIFGVPLERGSYASLAQIQEWYAG